MFVETENAVYESLFNHAQIEITGCCNMHCAHCRASMEKPIHMPLDKIEQIFAFVDRNRSDTFNLTISGGEPFVHPHLVEICRMAVAHGYKEIVITTNGSLVTDEILARMDSFSNGAITLQFSLDSTDPATHDAFRGYPGAYARAVAAMQRVALYPHLHASVRMTVRRETFSQMEEMVQLAARAGCIRIGIGNIIPAGEGAKAAFILSPEEKRSFLHTLAGLHRRYAGIIDITTEDPLKAVIADSPWFTAEDLAMESTDGVFGGCTAGIDCFNVDTEYNITPCSVFRVPIVNLNDYGTVEELEQAYTQNEVIRQMFRRTFSGPCNECAHKRICGGCRATAAFFGHGDFFASDGTCWVSTKGGKKA